MLNRFASRFTRKNRAKKSRLSQATVLVLAALMLSACSVFQSAPEVVDSGPVEQPLPAELPALYAQGLSLLQDVDDAEDTSSAKQAAQQTALAHWQTLSEQYPAYPGVWTNLALSQYQMMDYDESLVSLNKAQQLDSQYCPAFKLKGLVLRELGQFRDAESSYLAAAQCDPQDANVPYNLGILYDLYLADLDKALVQYQKAQAMMAEPDEALAIWIPDLQRRSGNNDPAEAADKQAGDEQ
ncbi:hypothetical protein [Bacterioplanoides sp.]|uniref:hypothetical protein n=1 Tax=Bacterioplanoides sp. TaxID=2066072 RepID=UPI003AFF6587